MGNRQSRSQSSLSSPDTSYINQVNDDPDFPTGSFSQEQHKEVEKAFKNGGIQGGVECLKREANQWRTTRVKIAVIGRSGVGKSAFINAIRDLARDDEEYAAVGVTETTQEVRQYVHPVNPLITFWDLPGVGTLQFPKETYLDKIGIDRFDCFVIMIASRFYEEDAWLGQEIKARNKNVYFVRSKIADDVKNDKLANGSRHNPEVVVETIKTDITCHLKNIKVDAPVFLIDSFEKCNYDFDKLNLTIIRDLPRNHRKAVLLSMSTRNQAIVRAKVAQLRGDIVINGIAAALFTGIPLVGILAVAARIDIAAIELAGNACMKQLGLDELSLMKQAFLLKIEIKILQGIVSKSFPRGRVDTECIQAIIDDYPAVQAGVVVHKIIGWMPIIGAVIDSPVIIAYTTHVSKVLLNKMESVALEIAELAELAQNDSTIVRLANIIADIERMLQVRSTMTSDMPLGLK